MDTTKQYPGIKPPCILRIDKLITFFHCVYPAGYQFKGEHHNFWEFVIVLDGAASICAGESIFHLKKGQCFWHKPGEFHSIMTEGAYPLHLGIFTFAGEINSDVSSKIFSVTATTCRQFIELRKMAETIFEFDTEQHGTLIAFKCLRPKMELHLVSFLGRVHSLLAHSLITELPNEQTNSPSADNYLRIIKVISQNLNTRMTIPEIATACNMSVSNAKRVFGKYAGCSITEYVNTAKIAEAKRLLATGTSVASTAEQLGFDDPNYFSCFFKRITGFPPSKYHVN